MKKPYNGDAAQTCPFRLGELCEAACPTCEMFQQFRGHNPNTGQEIDRWQCSISVLPLLMIENSQQQRATGAAVESFRNRMVEANEINARMLARQAVPQPPTLIAER